MGHAELKEALAQASEFSQLLKRLWDDQPPSTLWEVCNKTILANILDEGFRIYADPAVHHGRAGDWVAAHQAALTAVLAGSGQITVDTRGRLLAFGGWANSAALDQDGDGIQETLLVSLADCRGLLDLPQSSSSELETAFGVVFGSPRTVVTQGGSPPPDGPPPPRLVEAEQPESMTELVPETATDLGTAVANLGGRDVSIIEESTIELLDEEPEKQAGSSIPAPPPVPAQPIVTRVPAAFRDRVANGFSGFIGNKDAITTLTRELLRALLESPPHLPKNLLFTGSPSTGKTELARRTARILELPFVRLDGRSLASGERMVELLDRALYDKGQRAVQAGRDSGLPA